MTLAAVNTKSMRHDRDHGFHPDAGAHRAIVRPPGLRPLVRKDIADWRSGKGLWIVFIVTTLFMALQAANRYIASYLIRTLPADQTGGTPTQPLSILPLDNILSWSGRRSSSSS